MTQQGGDPNVTTMEQAMDAFPVEWATDDEFWGDTVYDGYYLGGPRPNHTPGSR